MNNVDLVIIGAVPRGWRQQSLPAKPVWKTC